MKFVVKLFSGFYSWKILVYKLPGKENWPVIILVAFSI